MNRLNGTIWLACASVLAPVATAQETLDRPNIILVMADDLGWSDIGCYGGEIATPHIDLLARDGLRFTQFYNNAICGPTRASLLTGLYCQQVGHGGDHWNQPKDFSKSMTIGEVLQSSGYRTMMVGKWQGRDSALDRGFDRFFGPMCQGKVSYFHEVDLNPFYLDRDRWQFPDDFYMTDAFNDYAAGFLREAIQADQPFFLYVAHIAPHWPLHARQADISSWRNQYSERGWDEWRAERHQRQRQTGLVPSEWKLSPRPPAVDDWKEDPHRGWQAERMAAYAAQVSSIDRGLGQLLKLIDASGQRENTLVLFLSDNGAAPNGGLAPSDQGFGFGPRSRNDQWRIDGVPIRPGSGPDNMPGPHDTFAAYGLAWANVSNTPLRGMKATAWEGGIRTPLVVRWPAVIISRNRMTSQPGHVIDFMATLLDVSNAKYPSTFEGRNPLPLEGKSLLPVLHGQHRQPHDVLCWSVLQQHAIRMGRWKAIRLKHGDSWQLFDLESDGTETTNLAEQKPFVVQRLADQFEAWQARVNTQPTP